MCLTKEQIQFIDNYLKGQGIKFWDVRIELVDHIASKLEENKDLILNRTYLIKEFGTSVTLANLVDEKQKIIGKKYSKLYFKEIINFFKNAKKITVLIVFTLIYLLLYKNLPYELFKTTSIMLYILPAIVYMGVTLKNHFLKEKSIHLERALFYLAFSFIILNLFIRFPDSKDFFNASITPVLIVVPLNMFLSFCGYMVYKRTYKKYSEIYKQLKST